MKTWTMRLGLSLMVVVGLWTSRTPAQERVPPPMPGPMMPPAPGPMVMPGPGPVMMPLQDCTLPPPYVVVAPTIPFIPEYHPYYPPFLSPPQHPAPAKHAVVRTLNHFGMACQADSFRSVGSFNSEMRWLFGSSRSFFGEGCCPPGQPCADRRNP